MNRSQYQQTARKVYWVVSAWTVLFAVVATWLIHACGASISDYGRMVRAQLGEFLGGAVSGLTLGVPAALVYLAVLLPLDRVLGVRCPHCRRSLTLRCRHERVVETG